MKSVRNNAPAHLLLELFLLLAPLSRNPCFLFHPDHALKTHFTLALRTEWPKTFSLAMNLVLFSLKPINVAVSKLLCYMALSVLTYLLAFPGISLLSEFLICQYIMNFSVVIIKKKTDKKQIMEEKVYFGL